MDPSLGIQGDKTCGVAQVQHSCVISKWVRSVASNCDWGVTNGPLLATDLLRLDPMVIPPDFLFNSNSNTIITVLSFFCMIRFMIRHNDNDLLVKYLQFDILLFAMFCAVPKPIDYENDVGCCIKCRLRCNWSGPHSAQWVRESQCWGRCWLYDVDLHACLCCKWYCTGLPLEVRIVPCVELGHDEGVGYNQNPVHVLYEEAWPIRTKPYAFDLTHSVFIQSARVP